MHPTVARAAVIAGLTLVAAAACMEPSGPPLPDGALGFTPPAHYRTWWQVVEACSGRTGDFDDVAWYQVPGASRLPFGDGRADAIWYSSGNRIVLAETVVDAGHTVRHEMLHALTGGEGHPREQFQERCGGIVTCADACVEEGGGPITRNIDAATVAAHQLLVGAIVTPAQSTRSVDGGVVTVVVMVENPTRASVNVPLPLDARRWGREAFAVEARDLAGTVLVRREQVVTEPLFNLLPGERRRLALDMTLPAGRHSIHPSFAAVAAPPFTYVVNP